MAGVGRQLWTDRQKNRYNKIVLLNLMQLLYLEFIFIDFTENNVQVFEAESVKTKHESSNEIHISSGNFKASSL